MSDKFSEYCSLFGLKKNFELCQLKKRFKEFAIKHHPDKGGNEHMFNYVSKAYKYLLNNCKTEKTDNELKQNFKNHKQNDLNKFDDVQISSDNFNQNFNKYFDKYNNSIEYNNTHGYEDSMLKSTSKRTDIDIPKKFSMKKFNVKDFNKRFEVKKNKNIEKEKYNNTQLTKYIPDSIISQSSYMNCYELGKEYENYTGENQSLQYTDYLVAHGNNYGHHTLQHVNKQQPIETIEDLERVRSDPQNMKLSDDDIKQLDEQTNSTNMKETQRVKHLHELDMSIQQHYSTIPKLKLK